VLAPLVTYPKTKCLVFGPLVGPPLAPPNPWFRSICGLQNKIREKFHLYPPKNFSFSGTLMCPQKKVLFFGPFVSSSPPPPPPQNREKSLVFWAGRFESKFSSRSRG
jgi:hypothetical protein